MSTILIVEDHALSRQALMSLLGYYGHRLLEASNGLGALDIARAEHPDLVITDIVMPTMDGIEFVRQLRADKDMTETPVIFYTATYRLQEARRLVEGFRQCHVIAKPSEPSVILQAVNGILKISPDDVASHTPIDRLDGLSSSSAEMRLAAFVDLSFHLLSQRDPARLLDISCRAVSNILNCRCVRLALMEENGQTRYFGEDEKGEETGASLTESFSLEEIMIQVVSQRRALRRHLPRADSEKLPGSQPSESFLVIPFATPEQVYGWLLLAGRHDSLPFCNEDEEMAAALGTQTALAYENLLLSKNMQEAKEKAEAAARAKSQFLANMSHELRTPMTGVLGMLHLALERPLDAQQREFIEIAETSARSLVRILNDILDMTKIEMGKLALEEKPFDLRNCVENTCGILLPAAKSKGLDFDCAVADNVPRTMIGDRMRLQQVLTNLAGNAIKFTEKGKVGVHVAAGDNTPDGKREVAFTITDTGIGIPDDKKHLLFHIFSQVDESLSRSYGGTGLGLAISKEIVELMEGTITFTSEVGKGSTFSFTVPLGEAESDRGAIVAPGKTAMVGTVPRVGEMTKPRILIAEDEQINRQVLELMLRGANYEFDFAGNGLTAVEMWENRKYDLILMDLQMLRMNGLEATGAIREKERTRGGHTPIVAITAHSFKEDEERCLAAGMDAYISKPIDFKQSLQVIKEILRQKFSSVS